MSDDDQTRPHKKHKHHDKQHHHGGGAACPSSGMDLMNPCSGGAGGLLHIFSDAAVEVFSRFNKLK
jgi:hypothetical protein